jgi:type IV secretion system protein TrbL
MVAPALTVLLIGAWMLLSSVLAPYVSTRILLMGANPAAAFAQGTAGVAQATLASAVGVATAAVTGGATAAGVVTAAAAGAMAGGTESAMRGGGSARTTATAVGGVAGSYGGRFMRRQTEAMEGMAAAESRRAAASERFEAHFADSRSQNQQRQSDFPHQPHHPNPNQAAIEIEARHV